jgi:hypothetical protein
MDTIQVKYTIVTAGSNLCHTGERLAYAPPVLPFSPTKRQADRDESIGASVTKTISLPRVEHGDPAFLVWHDSN